MRIRGFAPGTPCWVELASADPGRAQDFYASVFGWEPAGDRFKLRGRAVAGLALIVVIRPLTGFLSLRGAPGYAAEHWVIGAFGIRGIGSFYYLAYATSHIAVPRAELLWATVGFVVFVSVVLHGIAATPVMRLLDRFNERTQPSQPVIETP